MLMKDFSMLTERETFETFHDDKTNDELRNEIMKKM